MKNSLLVLRVVLISFTACFLYFDFLAARRLYVKLSELWPPKGFVGAAFLTGASAAATTIAISFAFIVLFVLSGIVRSAIRARRVKRAARLYPV